MMTPKRFISLIILTCLLTLIFILLSPASSTLPLVAIANWGPHSSLHDTISGLKEKLNSIGYIEGKNIRYEVTDVNFEASMIIQMLSKLKAKKPNVMVVLSTPVAQAAKNLIKDIPIIYADVTDPQEAGLITSKADSNITGVSDKQDLSLVLKFAKKLLPAAKKVGVLYSTGEANDLSLIKMLNEKANEVGLEVVAVPIEHTRDVVSRVYLFKNKVDFIYTGSSGAIQASLPAIAAAADNMHLPLFNFNSDEVISHLALASYGVSHKQVGYNAATIVARILNGDVPNNILPIYPQPKDHIAYISQRKAQMLSIKIPIEIGKVNIVE